MANRVVCLATTTLVLLTAWVGCASETDVSLDESTQRATSTIFASSTVEAEELSPTTVVKSSSTTEVSTRSSFPPTSEFTGGASPLVPVLGDSNHPAFPATTSTTTTTTITIPQEERENEFVPKITMPSTTTTTVQSTVEQDNFVGEGSGEVVDADFVFGNILFTDGDADSLPVGAKLSRIHSRPKEFRSAVGGDYLLELRDSSGSLLRSIPFSILRRLNTEFMHLPDSTLPELSSLERHFPVSFSVTIYNPPDYTSLVIKHRDQMLLKVERSANTPDVSISGVIEGQLYGIGDIINLSWAGTDLDGDALTYRVYYSTDGGNTYYNFTFYGAIEGSMENPVALETTNTNWAVEVDFLVGILDVSNQARFAVSVSDGTRSTFVESPVFKVT